MRNLALVLFVVVSLGEIVSRIIESVELHWICKPMIMITLAVYYLLHDSANRSTLVLLAIFFSLIGDTALMFESSSTLFFIVGLLAFLIAHGFYILAYRRHQHGHSADELQSIQKIRLAFPIILAGTGLVMVLYPALGVLKLPVIVYALILVVMVLNGLFRFGRTTPKSFWMVFSGALIFMISDSILAVNKFLTPIPHADALIMTTYTLAQFLLICGLCSHFQTIEKR